MLMLVESPFRDAHTPFTTVADADRHLSDSSSTTHSHDISIKFMLTSAGSSPLLACAPSVS